MTDTRTATPTRPFPFLVDLLKFLGSLRGDPELVGHVDAEAVIDWLTVRLNQLTGVPPVDFLATVARLVAGASLDGHPPGSTVEAYAGPRRDLGHVAKALRELDREAGQAQLWAELCRRWPIFGKAWRGRQAGTKAPARPPEPTTVNQKAAEYLESWRAILSAVNRPNIDPERKRMKAANATYEGPILMPGKGGQPKVNKAKLLEWWNRLEILWVTQGEGRNTDATVAARHAYGKTGEVVPDIGGHVKYRHRRA